MHETPDWIINDECGKLIKSTGFDRKTHEKESTSKKGGHRSNTATAAANNLLPAIILPLMINCKSPRARTHTHIPVDWPVDFCLTHSHSNWLSFVFVDFLFSSLNGYSLCTPCVSNNVRPIVTKWNEINHVCARTQICVYGSSAQCELRTLIWTHSMRSSVQIKETRRK